MKKRPVNHLPLFLMLILLAGFLYGCSSSSDDDPFRSNIGGNWNFYFTEDGASESASIFTEITQDGENLSFTRYVEGQRPQTGTGTVDGYSITMNADGDDYMPALDLSGVVDESDETRMSGTWSDSDGGSGTWEAFVSNGAEPVVLINLGDSLTNGVQSNTVNELTQVHGYTALLADRMKEIGTTLWTNPLLSATMTRKDANVIPFNLGVSGATVTSLISEKTGSGNSLLDLLMAPVPEQKGEAVSQLETAEYVAGLYPAQRKIFTLWVSSNDVLGAVTAGNGTELTADAINAFLSDTAAGHDSETVKNGLAEIVNRLRAIPDSEIFIANLPDITGIAYLLNESDLERLATFSGADVTVLAEGQSVGFGPFLNPTAPDQSIARALSTNNVVLNATIAATIAASDGYSLTAAEAALINARIDLVNAHIKSLADANDNVFLVDIHSLFQSIMNNEIIVDNDIVARNYGAGTFSLDGFHLSHTGYALVANQFIRQINNADPSMDISETGLSEIWAGDPYHDKDGDAYVPGPEAGGADSDLLPLVDCDDSNAAIVAPYVSGVSCP